MGDLEKKLREYRARKERQEKLEQIKTKTTQILSKLWPKGKEDPTCEVREALLVIPEDDIQVDETSSICSDVDKDDLNCCSYANLLYYALCFALWVIVYIIFIEFQFGTVFLVASAIFFMYFNTRTGPKRAGEVSAYSVFNKNCESINGTLKAEQFEREIRYGPAAVH